MRSQVWAEPDDHGVPITSYELEITGPLGYPGLEATSAVGAITSMQHVVTPVRPGDTYEVRLLARNAVGPSQQSAVASLSATADVPAAPPVLSHVVSTSRRQISLSWGASFPNGHPITQYELEWQAVDPMSQTPVGSPTLIVINGDSTFAYVFTYTDASVGYTFQCRAVNLLGPGPFRSSGSVVSLQNQDAPPQPDEAGIAVSGVSSSGALISWNVPSPAVLGALPPISKYIVQLTLEGAPSSSSSGNRRRRRLQGTASAQYTLTAFPAGGGPVVFDTSTVPEFVALLEPFTEYSVRLAASNSAGDGPFSSPISFVTLKAVPGVPGGPEPSTFTQLSMRFVWPRAAPGGGTIAAHTVELCRLVGLEDSPVDACSTLSTTTAVNASAPAGSPAALTLSSTTSGLTTPDGQPMIVPGRRYAFRVKAVNEIGASANYSAVAVSQTAARPDAPAPVALGTGINGLDPTTSIHAVWSAPDAHGSPVLTYDIEVDGQQPPLRLVARELPVLQYVVAPLLPGDMAVVRVRASNEFGVGDYSPAATLAAVATEPSVPTNFSYAPASIVRDSPFRGTIELTWSPSLPVSSSARMPRAYRSSSCPRARPPEPGWRARTAAADFRFLLPLAHAHASLARALAPAGARWRL